MGAGHARVSARHRRGAVSRDASASASRTASRAVAARSASPADADVPRTASTRSVMRAQLFEQAGDLAQFVGGAVERVFEQRRQRLRELGAQACAGGVGAGGELARDRAAAAHDVREAGAVGDVGERVRTPRQFEPLLETGGLRAVPGVGEHAGVRAVEQRRAGLLPGDRVADPRDRLLGLDGRGGGAERVAVGLVRAAELLEAAVLMREAL